MPCRDVTRHLVILDSSQTKVADFQVAILVNQDIGGIKVAVNDPCGVDIFQSTLSRAIRGGSSIKECQSYKDLIEKISRELIRDRTPFQKFLKVGPCQFCDDVSKPKQWLARQYGQSRLSHRWEQTDLLQVIEKHHVGWQSIVLSTIVIHPSDSLHDKHFRVEDIVTIWFHAELVLWECEIRRALKSSWLQPHNARFDPLQS